MKRWLLIGLIALITVPSVILGWLVTTESGMQWSYQRALQHLPDTLSVERLSGSLNGPLDLYEVTYVDRGQTFRAARVRLDWNPWELLLGRVGISTLLVSDLDIDIPTDADSTVSQRIILPDISLPLTLGLDNVRIDLISLSRGDTVFEIQQVDARARWHGNQLEIQKLEIASNEANLSLQGNIHLAGHYRHELILGWRVSQSSGLQLMGQGTLIGDLESTRLSQTLEGVLQANFNLELQHLLTHPVWQSQGKINTTDMASLDPRFAPLNGNLEFRTTGNIDTASMSMQVEGQTDELGAFNGSFKVRSLDGEHPFDAVKIETLEINALDGQLLADGELVLVPEINWKSRVSVANLNPARLFPQWPGEIEVQLTANGAIEKGDFFANIDIASLRGQLRGYPVSLQAQALWKDNGVDLTALNLTSGNTRMSVAGRIDETLDLGWSLESNDLAELYPQAGGSLTASGQLSGARGLPTIQASFEAAALRLADYRLEALNGEIDVDLLQRQQFDIKLSAQMLEFGEHRLETLDIVALPDQVYASMVRADMEARFRLDGRLETVGWKGQLVQADIQTRDFLNWGLKTAAAVNLAEDRLTIDRFCLQGDLNSEICGQIDGWDERWKFDIDVGQLPLKILRSWIPPDIKTEGLVSARLDLAYDYPEQLLGTVEVTLPQGKASYTPGGDANLDKVEVFEYRSGRFDMQLEPAGLNLNAALELVNGDRFESRVKLPGAGVMSIDYEQQPLQATARLRARNLSLIESMVDEIETLQGTLDIDIELAGTLATPRLKGKAQLLNGNLSIPGANLKLTRLNIDAQGDNEERIIYLVNAETAGGQVLLSGATDLNAAEGWPSKIQVEAESVDISGLAGPWLPENLEFEGLLNAKADFLYRHPDHLLGTFELELPSGLVSYSFNEDRREGFEYRLGKLAGRLEPEGLTATTTLDLTNGDHFDGRVELPSVRLFSLDLERQSFRAEARLAARDLRIVDAMIDEIADLEGELDLDIELSGTLAQPGVKGSARLVGGQLSIPRANLRLTQVSIDALGSGEDRISYVGNARVLGGAAMLRGDTLLDPARRWPSSLELRTESIDIASLLNSWLPSDIKIDGLLDSSARVDVNSDGMVAGNIDLSSSLGRFSYPLLEGELESWEYRDAALSFDLGQRGIRAESGVVIGDGNTLDGKLFLPEAKLLQLDFDQQLVEAEVQLAFRELAIIEALVPEIDQLQGSMALNFAVNGTLAKPRLKGGAEILEASVRIPRLGLSIDQINLRGTTDTDNQFKFQLEAHSAGGRLALEGQSQLNAANGWPTRINITGDSFEVSHIPEAVVTISPDLVLKLQHQAIDIRGDLLIPYARLQPKDLTRAAQVSRDTIIIGGDELPANKWQITTRINLTLGDRVDFFGFGFEGKLKGRLLVEEEPGQLTRGTGEISIPEGRYRAYGQRLDIENGRVLFTGGPLTDPGLDIRAIRTTGNVITGIQVNGRLRQPRLDLFSIPAMGQTDMLSYLLLGRPMESASGADGAMMAQAALALGLAGGDQLARSIGDRFGLDEMRIESNDTGDQASLVVGRYLSPRLYVSYGVGLIESFNSLNLRYQISEKWQVKAESGESQGADLLYTIER